MNLSQMIREVRRGLDELTPDFWTDEEIIDWLNEGAKIMTSDAQPFQQFGQFVTVAGKQEYALPADVDEVYAVNHFRTTLTPLAVTMPSSAQWGNKQLGDPTRYYLRTLANQTAGQAVDGSIDVESATGNPKTYRKVIGLDPSPSTAGDTITVFYYSSHFDMKALTDTSPIPTEFHRGPIAYAKAMGKEKDEAYAEMNIQLEIFKQFREDFAKKMTNAGQEQSFPQVTVKGEAEFGGFPTSVVFLNEGCAS